MRTSQAKRVSGKRGSSLREPLARPGDPLVTKDGEVIQADSLIDIGARDPKPHDVQPKDFRAIKRQDMGDLPADAHVMNACAAVFCYTILGISDREIQIALKIREDQLKKIREHEGYALIFSSGMGEMININSASMQARIAAMAPKAIQQIFTLAETGRKEETRLSASKDIADRAGTRVADADARQQGRPVGLRVIVTKKEDGEQTTEIEFGLNNGE
jgi:hypothetical protein